MESEIAKAHRKARQREYYRKHRDKILAQSRKFIQDHPEKVKEYHENAARKRENGIGYYQRYYALNKDKLLEYAKKLAKTKPRKGEGIPAKVQQEDGSREKGKKRKNKPEPITAKHRQGKIPLPQSSPGRTPAVAPQPCSQQETRK